MIFNKDDICVINSNTSHGNGRIVKVIGYANGSRKDILRVKGKQNKSFNITEQSLQLANKFDLIRNMSDEQLSLVLNIPSTDNPSSMQPLDEELFDYACKLINEN